MSILYKERAQRRWGARALRTLLATGELSQVSDDGPHGVNAYRINMPDPNPTTQGPTQP